MAITVDPMQINDGDPVTSDLLKTIVKNINLIAKGEQSSAVSILNTTETTTVKSANTVISKKVAKNVKPTNKPSASGTWTFPGTGFTSIPACWIQVYGKSGQAETLLRVHPVITSVDEKSMSYEIRSGAGATAGSVDFMLYAAGTLAASS
jgi:hypothetical protein